MAVRLGIEVNNETPDSVSRHRQTLLNREQRGARDTAFLQLDRRDCLVQSATLSLGLAAELHSTADRFERLGVKASNWAQAIRHCFAAELTLDVLGPNALRSRGSV